MSTFTTIFGIDPSLRSSGLSCFRSDGLKKTLDVWSIQIKDPAGSWPGIYAVSRKQYIELGAFIRNHWSETDGPVFGIMEHPVPNQRPGPGFVAATMLASSFRDRVGKDPAFIHPMWLSKLCGKNKPEKEYVRDILAEILSLNEVELTKSSKKILPENLGFDESDASFYVMYLSFGRGLITKLPPELDPANWTLETIHALPEKD